MQNIDVVSTRGEMVTARMRVATDLAFARGPEERAHIEQKLQDNMQAAALLGSIPKAAVAGAALREFDLRIGKSYRLEQPADEN